MARRNNNKMTRRSPKMEPVPLTLTFATAQPAVGGSVTAYIDLSQAASLVSRKFLRQGLNWGLAGMKLSALGPGTIHIGKLPNSWVMSNSWHKSFAVWNRMNNDALAESESIRPRFLDFKIYADDEHHAAGFAGNLLPSSFTGSFATPGEWVSSKIVIPDTTLGAVGGVQERELIATGGNYPGVSPVTGLNAVSLIEGYAASRLLPNVLDPNTPGDAADADGVSPENWMSATFNEGTQQDDDVIDTMITENNIAPYPFENDGVNIDTMYPGGANQLVGLEWHDTCQIYSTSATTNIGQTRAKGGNFPCGLIKIVWTPSESNPNLIIQLDMIPGTHRGYLAEPMQDM
jgi:hypothetical protein